MNDAVRIMSEIVHISSAPVGKGTIFGGVIAKQDMAFDSTARLDVATEQKQKSNRRLLKAG